MSHAHYMFPDLDDTLITITIALFKICKLVQTKTTSHFNSIHLALNREMFL